MVVVGRTLWDFIAEAFQTPGMRIYLLVSIVLLEVLLIVLILLIHSGMIGIRISFGNLGFELSPR